MLIYLSVVLGVMISIALPILRQMLPRPKVQILSRGKSRVEKFWEISKPYFITAAFSLLVAVIVVALIGDTINSWQKAFLAGYTADSTLQKLAGSQKQFSV